MKKILFITSNQNKLREVREILNDKFEIISLQDIDFHEDIDEPYDTIRENSIHKAKFFYHLKSINCIAEDSGLEVEALENRPSAFSARYAGEPKDDKRNLEKVLEEMKGVENRNAKFISVFTYIDGEKIEVFEGEMQGRIIEEPKGENGFGYDPIFIASGQIKTNAELSSIEKNSISHRKKALWKLVEYIHQK